MINSILFGLRWSFANLSAIVISLVVSAGLFLILPILQYMTFHEPSIAQKQMVVANIQDIIPQHRPKNKPPEPKAMKTSKVQQTDAPRSMARSRFAMDLGVGGGSGGGVAIANGGRGTSDQQSYSEGETDADATPIRQSPPAYPDEARKAGISGTVRTLLTIDENGAVIDVRILESPGDYGFETVIREAVSKWRYKPAEVNGIPVRQKLEQPFQF